jgi:hypothetical protein
MNRNQHYLLLGLVFSLLFSTSLGLAQTPAAGEVAVLVRAAFTPMQAVGIVFDAEGIREISETKISQTAQGDYRIDFSLPPEARIGTGQLLSALVLSEEGEKAYGVVTPLDGGVVNAVLVTPACEQKVSSSLAVAGQYALLESLVDVRLARRKYSLEKIQSMMSAPWFEKVQRIEKGFGFVHDRPLSPELNPAELNERLFHILRAIESYRLYSSSPSKP